MNGPSSGGMPRIETMTLIGSGADTASMKSTSSRSAARSSRSLAIARVYAS
jgi:hypothetical protein